MARQTRKTPKPSGENDANNHMGAFAPGQDRLEWMSFDGVSAWTRFGLGTLCIPPGVILLYLCPRAALVSEGTAGVIAAAFLFLFGSIFLIGGLAVCFYRTRMVVDRTEGIFTRADYVMFPFIQLSQSSHSLDNVVAVGVKQSGQNQDRYLIQFRQSQGNPIDVYRPVDGPNTWRLAESIALFLAVDLETVRPTPSEASSRKRQKAIGLRVGAICLLAVAVWFNFTYTYPLVQRAMVLNRYRDSDLVRTPCRVLACRVSKREFDERKDFRAMKDDGATYRVDQCAVVSVRFEYEFEGKRYESVKYGRYDNFAPDDTIAYTPGAQTVCYLNPKWPNEAVLSTKMVLRYGADPKTIVFFNLVLIVCFSIAILEYFGKFKHRRQYLKETYLQRSARRKADDA